MQGGVRWFLLIALLATHAARAADIQENEPLVMRLIFEDCLGYVRHDRTPFRGLATRPASRPAIETLNRHFPDRESAVELLSARYVAGWGADLDGRYCAVRTVSAGDRPESTKLLGVRAEGFIARLEPRAIASGFTEHDDSEAFSPIVTVGWYIPSPNPNPQVSGRYGFIVMPHDFPDKDGITDAGIIFMRGPPLRMF